MLQRTSLPTTHPGRWSGFLDFTCKICDGECKTNREAQEALCTACHNEARRRLLARKHADFLAAQANEAKSTIEEVHTNESEDKRV